MELSPWFESGNYRESPLYRAMSESQRIEIDAFREQGFVILEDAGIDPTIIENAINALDGLPSRSEYLGSGRLQDAWRQIEAVAHIATTGRILETLQRLYQREPIPFQTLNFRVATQQRAHSDTIHFNTLPHGFMCGVWIALEDTDAENGALFYHAGSQRLPVFHMHDFGLPPNRAGELHAQENISNYRCYEDKVAQLLADSLYKPVQAHLRKGQALIWSANIFHGGSPLLDPSRTRKSQVTHYYFPGCIYYTPLMSSPLEQLWMLRQVSDIRSQVLVPDYAGLAPKRSMLSRVKGSLKRLAGK
jgi:hypothetical protein